jgi:hypothetical protein
LLPYRELDDAFGLTTMVESLLHDWRTGQRSPLRSPLGERRGPRTVRQPLRGADRALAGIARGGSIDTKAG